MRLHFKILWFFTFVMWYLLSINYQINYSNISLNLFNKCWTDWITSFSESKSLRRVHASPAESVYTNNFHVHQNGAHAVSGSLNFTLSADFTFIDWGFSDLFWPPVLSSTDGVTDSSNQQTTRCLQHSWGWCHTASSDRNSRISKFWQEVVFPFAGMIELNAIISALWLRALLEEAYCLEVLGLSPADPWSFSWSTLPRMTGWDSGR